MYPNFEGLPEDKKKKIIQACIEEFAKNGYEKASTNTIVKNAGISKGILFHYFKNKKNLFLYLIDYSLEYFVKKFNALENKISDDIFERLMKRGMLKLKMAYEDPLMYELLFSAFINVPSELQPELQAIYSKYYNLLMPAFFEGLDIRRFRKGVDMNKAIETIMFCIEGISNKYISQFKNRSAREVLGEFDTLIDEYWEYIEILKYGVYQTEEIDSEK